MESWIKHPRTGEVFTFQQGMIDNITDTFELETDQNKMPSAGPMFNQGFDGMGIGKTITITGNLFDTTTTVTKIAEATVNDIRDKKIMKYWLESINTGFNANPCEFGFPFCEKAAQSGFSTTPFTDSVSGSVVNIPGTFVNSKGRIINLFFGENSGVPGVYPFSLTLWVCGF